MYFTLDDYKFDFMGIQNLPCEQRFLPSMAFNINKVIHVAYQSCTCLFLYTGCKQTNYVRDKPHERQAIATWTISLLSSTFYTWL